MGKQSGILIPLLAISVVLLFGYKGFGWENNFKNREIIDIIAPLRISDSVKDEAWATFQNYLEFARTHNLVGVKSLSHQISAACSDPAREKECFALMDSVYAIASEFKQSEFKYTEEDKRQIIMYTNGPVVAMLYFTKDASGTPKVLGMRFCFEEQDAR